MSSPLGSEGLLVSWEGRPISTEHSGLTATLCCSSVLHHTTPLTVENHNGNLTPAKRSRIELCNDDNNDEDGASSVTAAVLMSPERSRSAGGGRNRWSDVPSTGHYSSPNRSSVSGGDGCGGLSRQLSSRLGPFSRQTTMGSSLLGDSMTEIVIEDLPHEIEPTSALLAYCKRRFLRPYMTILSLVGLNPISTDLSVCRACLSYMQALFVLMLLLCGYFLQYVCSYRGDRGFVNYRKIIPMTSNMVVGPRDGAVHTIGELLFGYVIPNTLHVCGFISAVIVCKIANQEQLQNLIERVFLTSMKPRRLCRILWLYVAGGFVLLCLLFAYVVPSVLMQSQLVQVKWLADMLKDWQLTTKIIVLVTIFVQDLVGIVILSSYCIECYLLRVHLTTLSHKLLMHSIESLDWMREVLEFRKLLDHLNQRVAIPVCFFIVMNLAYAFAGLVYLFKDFDFHYSALKVVVLNIINVLLWLVMGLMPFFMAASVTRVCQAAQANGHQIRVRPFVYHNTSSEDLNSTLLFASSLDMSAKLFRMPIQPNYLCFAILVVSIVVLTLGMCLNLSSLGDF